MRTTKRPKASKRGLEAHYVSSTRPVVTPSAANGHWVIRPINSRTTTRIWRIV